MCYMDFARAYGPAPPLLEGPADEDWGSLEAGVVALAAEFQAKTGGTLMTRFQFLGAALAIGTLAVMPVQAATIGFDDPDYLAGSPPPRPWLDEYDDPTGWSVASGIGYNGTQGLMVDYGAWVAYDLPTPLTKGMGTQRISILVDPAGPPLNGQVNFMTYGGLQVGTGRHKYGSSTYLGVIFLKHGAGNYAIYGPGGYPGTYLGSFSPSSAPNWYQITFEINADWDAMTISVGPLGATPVSQTFAWGGGDITRVWPVWGDSELAGAPAYYDNLTLPSSAATKIGVWRPSTRRFLLDSSENDRWDGATGGDTLSAAFGQEGDIPLSGDWSGDGTDAIGVWRPSTRRFMLDGNGNDKWEGTAGGDDLTSAFGQASDLPVTGDWDGNGIDEVGVWRPSTRRFMLDGNGNGRWDGAAGGDILSPAFGLETDLPLAGDWNGDGIDEVGVWRPSTRQFLLDTNGNRKWDGAAGGDTLSPAFGQTTDLPVTGDWDNDGRDDVGVWRPSTRRFLLDANGNGAWEGTAGGDTLTAAFGQSTDKPVVGNW